MDSSTRCPLCNGTGEAQGRGEKHICWCVRVERDALRGQVAELASALKLERYDCAQIAESFADRRYADGPAIAFMIARKIRARVE